MTTLREAEIVTVGRSVMLPGGKRGLIYIQESQLSCPNCDGKKVLHHRVVLFGSNKMLREYDSCLSCDYVG